MDAGMIEDLIECSARIIPAYFTIMSIVSHSFP